MFLKRSRAYDPLFELDLDEELENDGGRKGKGRKRPRYSALNGIWRLNEDDSSPEPDQPEGTQAVAPEPNEDVEMHDTPSRPPMADGGVQTNESDLAPIPSGPINTPSKPWSGAGNLWSFEGGVSRPDDASRTDSGVQASPSRPAISAPTEFHEKATAQATPTPFGQATQSSGFAAFGLPTEASRTQGLGNAPSTFGAIPAASSNQGFGGSTSPFGTASHGPFGQGLGATTSPFGAAPDLSANQALGQTPSLFGMGSAQAQSPSSHIPDVTNGFGATSESVRFGFGQEPISAFAASPLETTQASGPFAANPYPESSLGQQDFSNYPLNASHNPVGSDIEDSPYGHGLEAPVEQTPPRARTPEQDVPLWPMGTQNFNASQATGRINAAEDLRSDDSSPERSPPGMIPQAVDDGTRNLDEMKQEGLLSQPVYRQGVSQEALPDQEDASAGEQNESMDSDEQAAYHDSEKGDDYDLRNYDRVSDDDEGLEDEEPLSDDELLDEGSEHWVGAEASYEEEEYDDEDEDEEDEDDEEEDDEHNNVYAQAPGRFGQPQLPLQAPAQKDKIVIDLLSDSDEDEPSVPPIKAPRSQIPLHESERFSKNESVDFSETESVDQQAYQMAPAGGILPTDSSAHKASDGNQEGADIDEAEDFEDKDVKYSNEEQLQASGDDSDPDFELAKSDDEGETEAQEATTVNPATETDLPTNSLSGAMDLDDGQEDAQADGGDREEGQREATIVHAPSETDPQPDLDGRDIDMAAGDEQAEYHAQSFQTQPDDVIASFQLRDPESSILDHSPKSHGASDVAMEDDNDREDSHSDGDGEPGQASGLDMGEKVEEDAIDREPGENGERANVGSDAEVIEIAAEQTNKVETTVESQDIQEVEIPSEQQDEPSVSLISQGQTVLNSAMSLVETSETTVISHAETQSGNQETILETQETEVKAHTGLSKPEDQAADSQGEPDYHSLAEETDVEMVDAEGPVGSELGKEQAGILQTTLEQNSKQDDAVQCVTPSDNMPEPTKEGIDQVPSLEVTADAAPEHIVHEAQGVLTPGETRHVDNTNDNVDDDDDDEFHEASEMAEQSRESPSARPEDSFASVDSQVSGVHDAEEAETAPEGKPKRVGKKVRNSSSSKLAKSTPASQKAQRQSSRQSSRQVSAQQAPSSQRTTRSKTMSFQAASPKEDKEDMSIQLARAALKSPTPKKKKAPTTIAKRLNTDLVKRLENDLPDCVALNNLRKYNANFVDVAAVAVTANIPPKRTPAREYASSFTITDPSVAPDGVVEVELYSAHKDYLPVVKTGDSVLLRQLLVVSLPGRGFGLKTKDESSWAVFKAEGNDEPEMNAATVEMSDKEASFMLDVRGWYAGLDDKEKGKLGVAVEELIAAGKDSRANK